MTQLILTLVMVMSPPAPDPTKPLPPSHLFHLLSGGGSEDTLQELVDAVPGAIDGFEVILNHPLSSPNHLARLYDVLALAKVDHKRFFKSALRDLNHSDQTVRRLAATFIGKVGGGSEFAAPLLMLALHDPSPSVSIVAMTALGKVGDEGTIVALGHLIQFGHGKKDTPERAKAVAEVFAKTREEIKARLAAKAAPPAKP